MLKPDEIVESIERGHKIKVEAEDIKAIKNAISTAKYNKYKGMPEGSFIPYRIQYEEIEEGILIVSRKKDSLIKGEIIYE